MQPKLSKMFLIAAGSLFFHGYTVAQSAGANSPAAPATANACRIIGSDTVVAGSVASFNLSPCATSQWTISCGTIVSQAANTVTVNFASASCAIVTLSATVGASLVSKSIIIRSPLSFSAGTPGAVTSQSITYGTIPTSLQLGPATGGLCGDAINYQWLASTDSIHFSAILLATAQNYQPGPLTATTWFRRQAGCSASGIVTSNIFKISVDPPLKLATISPSSQTINQQGLPAPISVALPGAALAVRYQWQSAGDPAFASATSIPGATSSSYAPDSLGSTTYYRVLMVINHDSIYSAPATVFVLPAVNAGGLAPASQTITTDGIPGLLTCTGFSGGNGIYQFNWFSSSDGSNWTLIPGVQTAGYNPGALASTTWFQVVVISNGVRMTSTKAIIYVNP